MASSERTSLLYILFVILVGLIVLAIIFTFALFLIGFLFVMFRSSFFPVLTILLITVGGILGGLGYEITDEQFNLPRIDRRTKNAFSPGCLGSALFGLLGGFVIFLVVPGEFNLQEGGVFDGSKLFAMAALGGYGGRILIERALDKQFKAIEKQVEDMQAQNNQDAKTLNLLEMQLDSDPDTLVDVTALTKNLLAASSYVLVVAFNRAREFRRSARREGRPEEMELVIPIFETLIEADKREHGEEKYHRNYGQLGYALKDKQPPDNRKAVQVLTKAIEIRDRSDDKNAYGFYELVRAICKIRLGDDLQSIKTDLDAALRYPKARNLVIRPNQVTDPEFLEWFKENEKQLKPWLAEQNIDLSEPAS